MRDKGYQTIFIKRLAEDVIRAIELNDKETLRILFTSCPRSGKTRMWAKVMKIVRKYFKKIIFIGVSVNDLPYQICEELKKVYEETGYKGVSPMLQSDITIDWQLNSGDAPIFNWSSWNKPSNLIMKDDVNFKNLSTWCSMLRAEGYIIVMFIDEAHTHTHTVISKQRINTIVKPNVLVEITATPITREGYFSKVEIPYKLVEVDGLVVPRIEFKNDSKYYSYTPEDVNEEAFDFREELKKDFVKEKSDCEPLTVIVCENIKGASCQRKFDKMVAKAVERLGPAGVAIVMANTKKTMDGKPIHHMNELSTNTNVKAVFTKTALAAGWNCPRAYIMVIHRAFNKGVSVFSQQLLSRILSTYDARKYSNNTLNQAYIFSSIEEIEHLIDNSMKHLIDNPLDVTLNINSRFIDFPPDFLLKNSYLEKKSHARTIPKSFLKHFKKCAKSYKLIKKIDVTLNSDIFKTVTTGAKITTKDLSESKEKVAVDEAGKEVSKKIKNESVQKEIAKKWRIDQTLKWSNSTGEDRILRSIYQFFREEMGFQLADKRIWPIVLHDDNRGHFESVIGMAMKKCGDPKEISKNLIQVRSGEYNIIRENGKPVVQTTKMEYWNPLSQRTHDGATGLKEFSNYYWEKCEYDKDLTDNEKQFIEDVLIKLPPGSVWIKQPDRSREPTWYCIIYADKAGELHIFCPDFIGMLPDGTIFIFDTKEGQFTDEEFKGPALQQAIKEENVRRRKLGLSKVIGGIADYNKGTGSWMYNDEKTVKEYIHQDNNLKNFKDLSTLLSKFKVLV